MGCMTHPTYIVKRLCDHKVERFEDEHNCTVETKCEDKCVEESLRGGVGGRFLCYGSG